MKSSIRLLAFTAAFLAACSIETAHAQDRPNAFPLLREARGGEVWITPPSAPGNSFRRRHLHRGRRRRGGGGWGL